MKLTPLRALVMGALVGLGVGCFDPLMKTHEPDAGALTCGEGLSACRGACINTSSNNTHCGACDTACSATQACAGGTCYANDCGSADCSAEQVCINDRCSDRLCVGVSCPAATTCIQGVCHARQCGAQLCPPGQFCQAGLCVETACVGVTCPANQSCVAGRAASN